jgi:hypothetical protein
MWQGVIEVPWRVPRPNGSDDRSGNVELSGLEVQSLGEHTKITEEGIIVRITASHKMQVVELGNATMKPVPLLIRHRLDNAVLTRIL